MYAKYIKPLIDRTVALVALVVLWPFILLTWAVLMVVNDGKAWFLQPRPGRHGEIFRVVKFKTMNDKRDPAGNLLPDAVRLTRVGLWVRRLSLDELPQLINVLKGDMSLVGPRPLLVEYLPRYNARQARRHEVRPGITGWAQVNGRNTLSWQQKFEYDVWYVEHCSFWLDIKILFLTVIKVFKADDINSATSATMEKFHGDN